MPDEQDNVFLLDEEHASNYQNIIMHKESSNDSTSFSTTMESLCLNRDIVEEEEERIDIHDYSIDNIPVKVGLADFELKSVIGKGAYGKVYLVRKKGPSNHGQTLFAMKARLYMIIF
jgi:hypothetical protein